MQTFLMTICLLQERHHEILRHLMDFRQAALDWTPGPDMNSISVLVFHLTGAERFWIGDVAAQEPAERDRNAEFKVHGVDADILKQRLADNLDYHVIRSGKITIFRIWKLHVPAQRRAGRYCGMGIASCTRARDASPGPDTTHPPIVGTVQKQD